MVIAFFICSKSNTANFTFVFFTETKNWVCNVHSWFWFDFRLGFRFWTRFRLRFRLRCRLSLRFRFRSKIRISSGSGAYAESDSSVYSGHERRLIFGVDGVIVPSNWGIGGGSEVWRSSSFHLGFSIFM